MKKIKKIVIFLVVVCLFLQILPIGNLPANYVWAEDDSSNAVKIDEENFPDDYFRTYVLNQFDSDKNGILDAVEQNAVTSVSVANKSVKSLSGIEYFNKLRILYCYDNQLENLDVSKNPALSTLYCYGNQLENLDVSKNPALRDLSCYNNQLENLDVSNNPTLSALYCNGNQLKNLDVSNNPALIILYCNNNQLENLDVSENPALSALYCYGNQLKNLDVSKNPALTTLSCNGNQLENLDVSKNPVLDVLYCYGNQLENLDVSNNPALDILYCYNNQLENLDVSKNSALTRLDCYNNQLENLDVSKNPALELLYCYNNQLKNLDVSNNPALKTLFCNGNQLENLDVSKNPALEWLSCNDNQLKNLDVSKNPALTRLSCNDNQLPYLDLSGNSVTQLVCYNNIYYINSASIDISTIEGFDIKKASDWINAEVDGTIVSVIDPNKRITYTYQVSDSKSITFSFQVVTFQVTFQDGDTVASKQTVIYGEAAEAPALSKNGYTLSCWDKDFDNITEDTTVNAVWTVNNYAIHYELNDGENDSSNPNEYTIESSTITLKNPSRTEYTFDGWYTDSALTEKVTEIAGGSIGDKTLYAKWSAVKYTINYQLNSGENNSSNPNEYTIESSTITLKNPSRTGYTFDGWYADSALTEKVTEITAGSTGDKTFYAKWSANKYKVTFQDGDTVASEQIIIYGEAAEAPVLSKTGYTLNWDNDFNNITEDTTVNAVWTANNYAIHYELNGGKNNSTNPNEYTIENTITLKNPSRTGYAFDGWYNSALEEKVTEIAAGSTGDKTFYAKWSAVKYAIKYQLNNGKNNSGNPSGYDITSSKITLKAPTRSGYTFGGWYADHALTKKVTEIAAGSTGEKTFYAKWSANKYKVNFDKNGGSIKTSDKSKAYTYGSKYKSLPKAARKNYEFVGWYTKKSGGSKITSNTVVNITKTTTFYARWKKVTVGKAAIHKLTNPKANQIKVSIKKVSGADGYEVLYSVNSEFRSSKKTTVKSTSAVLKNLKKDRTYYVKIRAYKKDSTGKKVYGKYSKVSKKEVTK